MLRDQDMVNDILTDTKASINSYTVAITECSNPTLRQTLQTLRNEAEQFQYQLYQIAEQKGWYMPAPQAHQTDVQQIKNSLSSSMQQTGSQNTNFTLR